MSLFAIFWLILAYILGSINSGVAISKIFYKKDIRDFGSNNAGSTNILRTFGKKTALAVFALDILKPVITILLCSLLTPQAFDAIYGGRAWLGFASILGQCYPVFFGFRGGKGAASTLGTMLVLFPKTVPIAAIIFLALIFVGNMVSLATLVAILLNTVLVYLLYPQYILPYLAVVFLIFWRHRSNIIRIIYGEETKLRKK